jgi:hypothetical protein
MTVMSWAIATRAGIANIGFLPCRLTPDGLVHPLRVESEESCDALSYLESAAGRRD